MSKLTDALGRQVGPLPLGVWLLAIAGGLGISYASRRAGGSDTPTAASYLAANTTPDGEIQTPDEAAVVVTPIFQLPELPELRAPAVTLVMAPAAEIPPVPVESALQPSVPVAAPAPVAGPASTPRPTPAPKTVTGSRKVGAPKTDKPAGGGSYTVKSGDTLYEIAARRMGAGAKWGGLYAANREVIEREARRRGRSGSAGGHWIYPGTVLRIP